MSDCNSIPLPTDPRFQDLTGKVFSRWTVLSYAGLSPHRKHRWSAVCKCGTAKTVQANSLVSGRSQSCGCLKDETTTMRNIRHGLSREAEYVSWRNMWARCTNPNHPAYGRYKDRAPPPEWRSFEAFYTELGPRPGPGFSLDRIDNEKPYGPGNCRWATDHVQNRNRSDNVWVTTPDGQTLCLTDACKLVGLNYGTVQDRRKTQSIEYASDGLLAAA